MRPAHSPLWGQRGVKTVDCHWLWAGVCNGKEVRDAQTFTSMSRLAVTPVDANNDIDWVDFGFYIALGLDTS